MWPGPIRYQSTRRNRDRAGRAPAVPTLQLAVSPRGSHDAKLFRSTLREMLLCSPTGDVNV